VRISRPNCEPLYTTNTSDCKQETFLCEYPLHWVLLPTKTHVRTLLFGSILLKLGRHFVNWNQPLNMSMRVWYLHCHEGGLYCCLVIHIEDLLRPLQLFYFHLWHIYWLSLVHLEKSVYVRTETMLYCWPILKEIGILGQLSVKVSCVELKKSLPQVEALIPGHRRIYRQRETNGLR
jgi:hypothetical protein